MLDSISELITMACALSPTCTCMRKCKRYSDSHAVMHFAKFKHSMNGSMVSAAANSDKVSHGVHCGCNVYMSLLEIAH